MADETQLLRIVSLGIAVAGHLSATNAAARGLETELDAVLRR